MVTSCCYLFEPHIEEVIVRRRYLRFERCLWQSQLIKIIHAPAVELSGRGGCKSMSTANIICLEVVPLGEGMLE